MLPGSIPMRQALNNVLPVTPAMASALDNIGLSMQERIMLERSPPNLPPPNFTVVLPGLARGCHSEEYMQALLKPCSEGKAAFVMVLQFTHGTAKSSGDRFSPSECAASVIRALDDTQSRTNCRLILAEQGFEIERRPCGQQAPLPDRVSMQTLAVGRAYEWAAARFPPALAYVRARLDDVSWSIPPSDQPPAYSRHWIAYNNRYATQPPAVSDRFAVVPAHLGAVYFDAWRIWSDSVNCNHNCFASSSIQLSERRTTHPRGECALSAWLLTAPAGIERLLAKNTAHLLVRQVNTTHIFLTTGGTMGVPVQELSRKGGQLLTYADAARVHSEFLKAPCDIKPFSPPP
mmetsp:Transcript_24441/g.78865  ORF Transcript_24441/g.78865 Transcript_24441/m.78865 type:complete len:347 (-) Transcript_24441:79-1119(-)